MKFRSNSFAGTRMRISSFNVNVFVFDREIRVVSMIAVNFWAYLVVDGHLMSIGIFFAIVYNPPPWYQIFTVPYTGNLVDIKVPVRGPFPVGPHRGEFIKCNFVDPFPSLPGFCDC